MPEEILLSDKIGIWVAAILTFCALSFLYKDNPFYKFAESLFVGVTAGYFSAIVFHTVFVQDLVLPVKVAVQSGTWGAVIRRVFPCLLGLGIIAQFSPKHGWLARYGLALIIGGGAGINLPYQVQTYLLPQIKATVVSLIAIGETAALDFGVAHTPFGDGTRSILWHDTISGIVVLIGVLAVLGYFFFSKEHKGAYGKFTKVGVYFLMIGFGASFGNTVMARMSLLIGRIQFLLDDWLGTMGMHIGG